jgi:hypothetical protein
MAVNYELIILMVSVVWLIILTVFFFRLSTHYNKLSKGVSDESLTSILEKILKDLGGAKNDIEYLKAWCGNIEKDGKLHIQKTGLLRFNPFKDTGGDQSFVLSLVDSNDTGVVISGLYSRSGTRWFAKKVVNGKALEYELSDEEKQSLKEANKKII